MVARGEIWWADEEEPSGAEPGYTRPVLVIQSNYFNRSGIDTVVTVALTTNLKRADDPGNVFLAKRKTGLSKDSVANVSQIFTIDKDALRDKSGRVGAEELELIEAGIRLVLDL